MKKLLSFSIALALIALYACGNKTNGTADGVDSTAILDSVAQADSVQKADSAAVALYLTNLYDLVLNNKGNYEDLTSHFSADVKKRLVAANEFDDGSMNLAALRTGNQDGPEDDSKLLDISKDGEWWVVSYSDMGTQASTKLKAEVQDGKVTVTDYQAGGAPKTESAKGGNTAADKAVAEFEEGVAIAIDDYDNGHGGRSDEYVKHLYNNVTGMNLSTAQKKRVEAAWKKFSKYADEEF